MLPSLPICAGLNAACKQALQVPIAGEWHNSERIARQRSKMPSTNKGDRLTEKQQQAFAFIAANPGCSIREIAEHCGITHQSAYERIGQLKRDGLITTGTKHQKRAMRVTAFPL